MSTQQPDLIESAKRKAAQKAVEAHFSPSFKHVGIGSGSTIVYVVQAIAETLKSTPSATSTADTSSTTTPDITFTPTGSQSETLIRNAGLKCITLDKLSSDVVLDVAFDGADEVDSDFNLIKGGGLCLFQEKCVAMRAKEFIVVADYRKNSERLLSSWGYVPVEVAPFNVGGVLAQLEGLGCPEPVVQRREDDGEPVRTDQGFFIVKAAFPRMCTSGDGDGGKEGKAAGVAKNKDGKEGRVWEPETLVREIKGIVGVLDVGLFVGVSGPTARAEGSRFGGQKPVAVYFGMEDGGVMERSNR
ncbi:MAG: ribose-5-phosphate isomerase rki1 [Alyxoria varia]|nr:MAG: ribose-5-phosphate isomerase rki1 [Alyxoria varia]